MRVRRALLLLGITLAIDGCASSRMLLEDEMAKSNLQVVLAFEETVFNKHQVREAFSRYVGSTYKQHDPAVPDGRDAAIRALDRVLGMQYPNARTVVKRTIARGDYVWVQALWEPRPGESRGEASVDIYRLENARIVEHWGVVQAVPDQSANDNTMF
jgi:predicted SnoaL-like aldol condensation-catalyzing enzyme